MGALSLGATPAPPVQPPVSPGAVTAPGGFVGRRLRLSAENYLRPFSVDTFVAMLERPEWRDWWWIGEQPGKWLHSSILASATFEDPVLQKRAEAALARIVKAQNPDGYLGITAPDLRTKRTPVRGMDPYELYFTINALCAAWESWKSEPALAAARRLANYLITTIAPGKAEFYPLPRPVTIAGHEVHYGLEGALLINPMMRLYEDTSDARYLEWVQWCLASLDRWSNCDNFSNLDKVAAGAMTLNQIQPYVHAHTLHMVLLGVLRLYRVTGEKSLLDKSLAVYRSVAANYAYITGGVSTGEHYGEPHKLPNSGSVVETCASYSWILLNQSLLEITGNPAHADAIERLMFNHVLAAQTIDGDDFRYHCPLNGWKPLDAWTGPDCCSASGNMLLAELPGTFYTASADTLTVNQFVPSSLRTPLATLVQNHDYPVSEEIVIEVRATAPSTFSLRIRVPAWCENPSLRINGNPMPGAKPGAYATFRREWRPGDKLSLTLPMAPRWISGDYDNRGLAALTRGPVVFCLDSAWITSALGDQLAGDRLSDNLPGVQAVERALRPAATPPDALGPVYEVDVRLKNGSRVSALLLPYANLGRWYRSEAEHARGPNFEPDKATVRPKRPPSERTFPYSVWLRPA